MKKGLKLLTSCLLATALLSGCTVGGGSTTNASSASSVADKNSFTVGIVQLVQHPALDQATKGFRDALTEEFGEAKQVGDPGVYFDEQKASGDSATCITIANAFVAEKCDLIMANATPALQAAASATNTIPILGTSVTEYGTALSLDNFNGTVGGNISGTSDLAPLDQQAAMFDELLPNAQRIGILYCSAEPNSVYQAKVVQEALEKQGKTVSIFTFTDSGDVTLVTQDACQKSDALYIPTDNTAASCTEAIDNTASQYNMPIITGEEGICKGCGIATLSIDYYELGVTTGKMAIEILKGEKKVSEMPIEYYANPVKEYDAARCEKLGISIPEGYTAIQ